MAIIYFICIKSSNPSYVGTMKPIVADIDINGHYTDQMGNIWQQTGFINSNLPGYPDAKVTDGYVGYNTAVPLSDSGDVVTYSLAPLKTYKYDSFIGMNNDALEVESTAVLSITSQSITQQAFSMNNDALEVDSTAVLSITSQSITPQDISMTNDALDVNSTASLSITSKVITQQAISMTNDVLEVDSTASLYISSS